MNCAERLRWQYVFLQRDKCAMEKIIMIIERSKDMYCAYPDNCDGIYAAGDTIEETKDDVYTAIRLIKENLPEERWPQQIKGDFEIEWRFT